ncbi:hypothetical protein [Paenibacillus gallinarum]
MRWVVPYTDVPEFFVQRALVPGAQLKMRKAFSERIFKVAVLDAFREW